MYLNADQSDVLRKLLYKLYTWKFDESLVLAAADSVCNLLSSHYFSFNLVPKNEDPLPFVVSNNPPGFMPVYFSVARKDFLLDAIAETHGDYVLSRMDYDIPEHRDFIHPVQRARPISDIIYTPVKVNGLFSGFWGVARAGLSSPVYSDEQLEIFRFIKGFLNDAFQRSLIPPALEGETAYLDFYGHIIDAGAVIRKAFDAVFGRGRLPELKLHQTGPSRLFLDAYSRFLNGPFRVGMERLTLFSGNNVYMFMFKLLRPQGFPVHNEGLPFASVALIDQKILQKSELMPGWTSLSQKYRFTHRENQVIRGIYRGLCNKAIAYELGIEESTVKRHTHNVFEKTGLRSRVELVLRLSNAQENQLKL